MRKLIVGAAAVIAVLALAMVLFGSTSGSAKAVIHGISASPSTKVDAGATITLSINADDGAGDVTLVATAGTFSMVLCTDNAVGGWSRRWPAIGT